jgi:RNA methyltransferase, TrmH family
MGNLKYMLEKITSVHNPRIKNLIALQRSRERRLLNRIIIEGYREINLALAAGFPVKELYSCRSLDSENRLSLLQDQLLKNQIFEISVEVFEKLAYREASDGLIAVAEPIMLKLEDIQLRPTPLIVVLEAVEKPGNLGAMLRTADAANVDAVIVCDPLSDLFNPNTIRSSIGCIFTKQVVACTSSQAIDWLREKKISTYAAALIASNYYHETDLTGPTAFVMGAEATGLSRLWLGKADYQVKIPMLGRIDSLNVATSAAILVFEAMRQRGFK